MAQGETLLDRDTAGGPTVAEVVDAHGRVIESSVPAPLPLISAATLLRVIHGQVLLRSTVTRGAIDDWLVLALPVSLRGGHNALVLKLSLEPREETLQRLLHEFLLGGLAALVLASLAGYGLAAGALRPVEAMRRRAESITAADPGNRLPVPSSGDELARLATTLNDMIARLEASLEHERRFVDNASHELRTPLALLRTELEIALRHPRPPAELEQALRSAAEETERLIRLAEDLLLVARSDNGQLPIRREPVAVEGLLEDVAARFVAFAREQGRSVSVEPDGSTVVDADAGRLAQALGSLVENALAHGSGSVVLAARRSAGQVELHVTDQGRGFPEHFVARAFDRFSRADEARSSGGTGLGLAIVELIARAHGGSAALANRSGGGADVWVAIPAVSGSTGGPGARAAAPGRDRA